MRIHVIYAHPLADSFAAALHARIVAALGRSGHQVDDCDLYSEGFNPVLTAAERRSYNTQNPDLAAVAPYVARLQAAEALVLCFPTWWYGMPAILKGWFDRVWARGVAFELPPGGGAITPALVNIKKFVVITTYGSSWWLIKLVLRDPVRAAIMGGLGRLCAPRVQTRFLALYNIDTASRQRCAHFFGARRARVGPVLIAWFCERATRPARSVSPAFSAARHTPAHARDAFSQARAGWISACWHRKSRPP